MTTYYDLLEIPKDATEDMIKRSYRALSLKYHPDRPNGNEEQFKNISHAYEILSDPLKRQQYDNEINYKNYNSSVFTGNNTQFGNPLFDILRAASGGNPFFSRGGGGADPFSFAAGGGAEEAFFNNFIFSQFMRPPSITQVVSITFEQSFLGCKIPIIIHRNIVSQNSKIIENENIDLIIPVGTEHEDKIVLNGKGNVLNGNNGDVVIVIEVQTHERWRRNGLNLLITTNITLKEALCGFSFDIKLINDKVITIRNNSSKVIYHNYEHKCEKYGFTKIIDGNSQTGDLIIIFNIIYPETITQDQRQLIEENF